MDREETNLKACVRDVTLMRSISAAPVQESWEFSPEGRITRRSGRNWVRSRQFADDWAIEQIREITYYGLAQEGNAPWT